MKLKLDKYSKELLERHGIKTDEINMFSMHQSTDDKKIYIDVTYEVNPKKKR